MGATGGRFVVNAKIAPSSTMGSYFKYGVLDGLCCRITRFCHGAHGCATVRVAGSWSTLISLLMGGRSFRMSAGWLVCGTTYSALVPGGMEARVAGSSSTLPTVVCVSVRSLWCLFGVSRVLVHCHFNNASRVFFLIVLYERLLRHGAGAYVERWQAYRTSATDRGNNKFPRT